MSETSYPWLQDDSPIKHKIVRIMLFLTSFSWTSVHIEDYMGGGSPVEKILTRMLPMLVIAVYCVTCEHRDLIKRMFRPGLFLLLWYVGFSVLCGFRGIQPALCAWKGAEIIITLMYIYVSCRDADSTRKEFIAFLKLFEILMWATVVLAFINPTKGFLHSPTILPWLWGYFPILNPNAIGFISALCLARLLFFPAKYKPVRIMMITATLLCAQSRTAYAVSLVAMIIYIFDGMRTKQFGRVAVAFLGAALALFMAMGWNEAIVKVLLRGESAEEVSTLSGRTDYWNYALDNADWLGKGLATGSRSLIFGGEGTFHRGSVNMHNSFIEALMGGGYIGSIPFMVLFAVNVIRQGFNTVTKPSTHEGLFLICAITFVARGMTSIVLALFSFDFINMMFFWAWLYTRNMDPSNPPVVHERPKPRVFEKTLAEQRREGN
ncbi:MAG: O-antigen ligase family protein [Proteobacteria bacterium]|nr:O-antigen ligase family protein [Pseudomonadota bacterium]